LKKLGSSSLQAGEYVTKCGVLDELTEGEKRLLRIAARAHANWYQHRVN